MNLADKNFVQTTPIVLVHGAWHGAWCWDPWKNLLEDIGFTKIITIELRGHGQKEGNLKHARIQGYVEDIEKVLDDLDTPPILIGHSLGCSIIERVCSRKVFPAAVLLAPIPDPKTMRKIVVRTAAQHPVKTLTSILRQDMNPWVAGKNSHKLFFSPYLSAKEAKRYTAMMKNESLELFLLDLTRSGPKINSQTPFLVVAAENDKFFSVDDQRATADSLGADYFVIPDSGHDIMLDANKEEAFRRMHVWLNRTLA